jgi:hypothetical protein
MEYVPLKYNIILLHLTSFYLLPKTLRTGIYKRMVLPVALYRHEIWSPTLRKNSPRLVYAWCYSTFQKPHVTLTIFFFENDYFGNIVGRDQNYE